MSLLMPEMPLTPLLLLSSLFISGGDSFCLSMM